MLVNEYNRPFLDWMYLERYVNSGSDHRFARQTEVPKEFRPESQISSFRIKSLEGALDQNSLLKYTVYPLHPYTALLYEEMGHQTKDTPFLGMPTSSTRTMAISDDNFNTYLFLKFDLPVTISRFDRSINRSDVIFSLQLQKLLKSIRVKSSVGHSFGVLPEISGGHTVLLNERDAGYIIRKNKPLWLTISKVNDFRLIPSFAMISRDTHRPQHPPLLIQLTSRGNDPLQIFLYSIVYPLLEFWFELANQGILWEMQQQNTLFALDKDNEIKGIIVRDYDGVYIDRRYCKESLFIKHVLSKPEHFFPRYSNIFDHRVCKQNVLRLVETFVEYYPKYNIQQISDLIASFIAAKIPPQIYESLPHGMWYTVPEVFFKDGIELAIKNNPPFRQ